MLTKIQKIKDLTGILIKLRAHKASDADSIYKNIRDQEIKKYRNKGYITEAIKLIVGFAFNELKLNRISARLWENNLASIKVLKKNKFKKEGLLREMVFKAGKWQNDLVYAVIRKDWDC